MVELLKIIFLIEKSFYYNKKSIIKDFIVFI